MVLQEAVWSSPRIDITDKVIKRNSTSKGKPASTRRGWFRSPARAGIDITDKILKQLDQ